MLGLSSLKNVAAVAALVAAGWTGAASATTITFDGAVGGGNPAGTYVESGYAFTPNAASNDGKCSDPACLNEFKQGDITTMTAEDGTSAFDLDGFSFILVGNGTDPIPSQNIVVAVEYEDGTTASMAFTLDDLLTDFGVNFSVVAVTDPTDTTIEKNNEYAVTVLNGFFDDVVSVSWTTNTLPVCVEEGTGKDKVKCPPESAQARLDSVIVSDPAPVPLPAAGLLLLGGLGALGAAAKRRRKAA